MTDRLGLWEIAILALLREGPMHPYQMQSLLRQRHKDKILQLKRGSLYHAINRLLRTKMIEAWSNSREGRRPERTTYRVLRAGQEQLVDSLLDMIAVPQREASEFLASMSFIVYLSPKEAAKKLEERSERLRNEIRAIEAGLLEAGKRVDRLHLIESEYLLAMRNAELRWVRGIAQEIAAGELTWNLERIFMQLRAAEEARRAKPARRTKEKTS